MNLDQHKEVLPPIDAVAVLREALTDELIDMACFKFHNLDYPSAIQYDRAIVRAAFEALSVSSAAFSLYTKRAATEPAGEVIGYVDKNDLSHLKNSKSAGDKTSIKLFSFESEVRRITVPLYATPTTASTVAKDTAGEVPESRVLEMVVSAVDCKYETRASFAKHLGLAASYISDCLNGNRPLTDEMLAVAGIKRGFLRLAAPISEDTGIEQTRANFEDWYVTHIDGAKIGSSDCAARWSAWLAGSSGCYKARDGWKIAPLPWDAPAATSCSTEPTASVEQMNDWIALIYDNGYALGDRLQRLSNSIRLVLGGADPGKHVIREQAQEASIGDALPPLPANTPRPVGEHYEYTKSQMHAYVLADRAARAGKGSVGDPANPKDDSDRTYTKPIGYIAAAELSRIASGHDANMRSARFGPSPLDGDIPVYIELPLTNGSMASIGEDERFKEVAIDYRKASHINAASSYETMCMYIDTIIQGARK
jgi:hypothetical protein